MLAGKERIALFDFCETLVSFQTADAFVAYVESVAENRWMRWVAFFHRLLRKSHILSLLFKMFPNGSVNKRLVALRLRGIPEAEMNLHAQAYYEKKIRPALISAVVDQLLTLQSEGWRIVLVSGGYESYLVFFAREFNLLREDVIATRLKFRNGRCTGRLAGKDCMYNNKIEYLEHHFQKDKTESIAFSDSKSDLPLLLWADRGVVVAKRSSDRIHWGKEYGFSELLWD